MQTTPIDGKALAKRVRKEVKKRARAFEKKAGRRAALHVVLVGEDPASQVYVRSKERAAKRANIDGEVHRLAADIGQEALVTYVKALNDTPEIDGILVQLPLPAGLDADLVIEALDPKKDVDGLTTTNIGLLVDGRPGLRPCTPSGCIRLLEEAGCELEGKRALVIGRSALVGKPIAMMLLEKNATVTIAHSRTRNLEEEVGRADVVIAAVGRLEMVRGEWLKPGAVVIDVGINRDEDGKLRGDVHYESTIGRAKAITPVPGGVGPMTIAMLLSNTVDAAEARLVVSPLGIE